MMVDDGDGGFLHAAVQKRQGGTWRRTRCMKTRQLKPSWNALTATLMYRSVKTLCVDLSIVDLSLWKSHWWGVRPQVVKGSIHLTLHFQQQKILHPGGQQCESRCWVGRYANVCLCNCFEWQAYFSLREEVHTSVIKVGMEISGGSK